MACSLLYLWFDVQAILSAPEQRLTLNQIYDWMITCVAYFSERQDQASSAGWKVNILGKYHFAALSVQPSQRLCAHCYMERPRSS